MESYYKNYNEYRCIEDKIAGFFMQGRYLGYSYSDIYDLFLNSREGQGIRNNEYAYAVHWQGRYLFEVALEKSNKKYKKGKSEILKPEFTISIARLLLMAHNEYDIEWNHMFDLISMDDFIKDKGIVIGDYDDKLIRRFLLGLEY